MLKQAHQLKCYVSRVTLIEKKFNKDFLGLELKLWDNYR